MMNDEPEASGRRSLLFCAHPGHELRVHGWLKRARPTVCFLTDGSGSAGASRLRHSSDVVASAGASTGPLYGIASDRSIYTALLDGDIALFCDLAEELGRVLVAGEYSVIAGDAAEWYNPSHDVARMVVDAAVRIANGQGAAISNYAFPLVGDPRTPPPGSGSGSIGVTLDAEAVHEKIETARAYARKSADALVGEVDDALERFGIDAFRDEPLFVAADRPLEEAAGAAKPFYETYGERQVASGHYRTVIRWNDHLRPVDLALRQLAGSSDPAATIAT